MVLVNHGDAAVDVAVEAHTMRAAVGADADVLRQQISERLTLDLGHDKLKQH